MWRVAHVQQDEMDKVGHPAGGAVEDPGVEAQVAEGVDLVVGVGVDLVVARADPDLVDLVEGELPHTKPHPLAAVHHRVVVEDPGG